GNDSALGIDAVGLCDHFDICSVMGTGYGQIDWALTCVRHNHIHTLNHRIGFAIDIKQKLLLSLFDIHRYKLPDDD
ncbi:hypothetical protein JKG47_23900, partial [Acidithiobacillus sp. MC6.1]|nr:hypothetical protein [Acidithiobacillus sp. MC6.1]